MLDITALDRRKLLAVGCGTLLAGVLPFANYSSASAVFIDAFVPEGGKSLADYTPPQMKSVYKQMLEDGKPAGPPPVETWGDRWGSTDLELRNWVADRVRPQSPLTFLEPVDGDPYGKDVQYTYIRCERNPNPLFENFAKQVQRDARWQYIGLDSHHEAMLLELSRLVEMLAVVA